jgi:protein gp37
MNDISKSIGWAQKSWNPVVGCQYGCSYCYAKKMNDRFKFIPNWEIPVFFKERLNEPLLLKKPSVIFVGSMCDLFGDWVNIKWIDAVIEITKQCPQHTFMFLTKNPVGYNGFSFPENCRIGLTITSGNQQKLLDFFYYSTGKRFLSIEPLLGSFEGIIFPGIDMVIIGAMTGKNAVIPKKEWIHAIEHPNRIYKKNIRIHMAELEGFTLKK